MDITDIKIIKTNDSSAETIVYSSYGKYAHLKNRKLIFENGSTIKNYKKIDHRICMYNKTLIAKVRNFNQKQFLLDLKTGEKITPEYPYIFCYETMLNAGYVIIKAESGKQLLYDICNKIIIDSAKYFYPAGKLYGESNFIVSSDIDNKVKVNVLSDRTNMDKTGISGFRFIKTKNTSIDGKSKGVTVYYNSYEEYHLNDIVIYKESSLNNFIHAKNKINTWKGHYKCF